MPTLAVQLYTLRDLLARDLEGTLDVLAATGVEAVETAGLHGRSAAGFRSALNASGLAACSCHVPLDRFEAGIEEAKELGADTVVVPWAPAPATAADADELVGRLAAVVEAADVRVAYHNHDFEFLALDDGTDLWQRLTAADTPWLLEPDVGWLQVAGRDPAAVLRELAGRCPLVHAKDVRPSGHEWHDVPVGDGVLDWAAIAAAAREAGTERLVVEFDTPTDDTPADVGRSLQHLRGVLAA